MLATSNCTARSFAMLRTIYSSKVQIFPTRDRVKKLQNTTMRHPINWQKRWAIAYGQIITFGEDVSYTRIAFFGLEFFHCVPFLKCFWSLACLIRTMPSSLSKIISSLEQNGWDQQMSIYLLLSINYEEFLLIILRYSSCSSKTLWQRRRERRWGESRKRKKKRCAAGFHSPFPC